MRQRTWFIRNMWSKKILGTIKQEPDDENLEKTLNKARKKYWVVCNPRMIEIFNPNVKYTPPESFRDWWMERGY